MADSTSTLDIYELIYNNYKSGEWLSEEEYNIITQSRCFTFNTENIEARDKTFMLAGTYDYNRAEAEVFGILFYFKNGKFLRGQVLRYGRIVFPEYIMDCDTVVYSSNINLFPYKRKNRAKYEMKVIPLILLGVLNACCLAGLLAGDFLPKFIYIVLLIINIIISLLFTLTNIKKLDNYKDYSPTDNLEKENACYFCAGKNFNAIEDYLLRKQDNKLYEEWREEYLLSESKKCRRD